MTVRWINRWWEHLGFWLCYSARHPPLHLSSRGSVCLHVHRLTWLTHSLTCCCPLPLPFLLVLFLFSFFFLFPFSTPPTPMSQGSKSSVCLFIVIKQVSFCQCCFRMVTLEEFECHLPSFISATTQVFCRPFQEMGSLAWEEGSHSSH